MADTLFTAISKNLDKANSGNVEAKIAPIFVVFNEFDSKPGIQTTRRNSAINKPKSSSFLHPSQQKLKVTYTRR